MENYTVKSPVLLLTFNRPDFALQVFNKVKQVKPHKLYIAADGPRKENKSDENLCIAVRKIYDNIDWPCDVFKLFRDENLGCKYAVSGAITWFFQQEEEGIILEDDCVPANDFFYFCDEMLQHYRHDTRMMNITGTNLQMGTVWGDGSYYFSQYSHIWGWASWRRAWNLYDAELSGYNETDVAKQLKNIFTDPFLAESWIDVFRRQKSGEIDSWDYQFNFATFFQNGLCVTPNKNLISNIGFREDATHTYHDMKDHAALPLAHLNKPIVHPTYIVPQKEADYFFLKKDFWLEKKWAAYNKDQLLRRRFKRWVKSIFTSN
jgi:hypothetical protein